MKVELKSAIEDSGEQYVMINGIIIMPLWSVDNLDTQKMVKVFSLFQI